MIKAIFTATGISGAVYLYSTAGMSDQGMLTVNQIIVRAVLSVLMISTAWIGSMAMARIKNATGNNSDSIKEKRKDI